MIRTLLVALCLVIAANAAWADDGKDLYDKKCKACHSIAGVAGPMAKMGGALDGVGAKHDEAWLRAYIQDPKSKMPGAKMPKVKLTDDELNAIITYMVSLKEPAKAQ